MVIYNVVVLGTVVTPQIVVSVDVVASCIVVSVVGCSLVYSTKMEVVAL